MTMKWSGRLRMQRLDTDGNPLGPAMYSDQTLRLKLTTDPDGDRRLFAEAPPIRTDISFTATIPRVQGSLWFPYEDPRWWFVAALWRAQNEQLAIESRAGQYRRLWDERQRGWRRFWQQAVEDGLIAADGLSFPVRRWLPGNPTTRLSRTGTLGYRQDSNFDTRRIHNERHTRNDRGTRGSTRRAHRDDQPAG